MNRYKTIIEFGFGVTEKIIQIPRLLCIGQIETSTSFSPGIPLVWYTAVFSVFTQRSFPLTVACEQALCFGEKNSKEREGKGERGEIL